MLRLSSHLLPSFLGCGTKQRVLPFRQANNTHHGHILTKVYLGIPIRFELYHFRHLKFDRELLFEGHRIIIKQVLIFTFHLPSN